jgi:threonine/homoserine/homoserine lactone efflux protein
MEFVYSLLFGLLLGFTLTIPPGPMNALIASESVISMRRGVIAGSGAMSADLLLGLIVFSLRSVFEFGQYVRAVYGLGAVMVAYFGVSVLRSRAERRTEVPDRRIYARALAVGLTNPFQILWWLTAGLAFAYLGGVLLFAGLFGAIAIWICIFPWALHSGVKRSARAEGAVTVVSASLMFVFAAYFALLAAGLI